jgi:ERCC4-type nuclease
VTERLTGHQLPGLVEAYRVRWLLIEGVWRSSERGFIEVPAGRSGGRTQWKLLQPQLRADGLEGWLLTLQLRGGIHIHRVRDMEASAAWLACLYHWWTGKAWTEHRGHLALGSQPDPTLFQKPTLARRVAAELPGIGYEKSQAVEHQFPTVQAMVQGSEAQWLTIPGIGTTLAARAYRSLREPS